MLLYCTGKFRLILAKFKKEKKRMRETGSDPLLADLIQFVVVVKL